MHRFNLNNQIIFMLVESNIIYCDNSNKVSNKTSAPALHQEVVIDSASL